MSAFNKVKQLTNDSGDAMRLKEKVVLITGASGEIGAAMTKRFLAEGAS